MECKSVCEIDKFARSVLRYNYPTVQLLGDIRDVTANQLPQVDLWAFGSPCQGLSTAGKHRGFEDARSGLFRSVAGLLGESDNRPRYIIWENVPGVLTKPHRADFIEVLNTFVQLGARDIAWRVLDARHAGVPQRRRRVFVVVDLTGRSSGNILGVSPRCARHPHQDYTQRQNTHDSDWMQKDTRTDCWGLTQQQTTVAHELAPTLTVGSKSLVAYGSTCRRYSPIEQERLMGWPDGWTARGINERGQHVEISDTQRYKMMGNGVVAPVAEQIGRRMLAEFEGSGRNSLR